MVGSPLVGLYGGRLALEQFHLSFGILADNVVGSAATPNAKPFLKLGIPSDFRMFHCDAMAVESIAENSMKFPTENYLA